MPIAFTRSASVGSGAHEYRNNVVSLQSSGKSIVTTSLDVILAAIGIMSPSGPRIWNPETGSLPPVDVDFEPRRARLEPNVLNSIWIRSVDQIARRGNGPPFSTPSTS